MVEDHISILRIENLATNPDPMIMRSADGCLVEVFEWKSADAIIWLTTIKPCPRYGKNSAQFVITKIPVNVAEFQQLFSEFEILN